MQPELPLRVEPQFPPTAEIAEKAVDFLARQREPADMWGHLLSHRWQVDRQSGA
jgi:hypothetical protein